MPGAPDLGHAEIKGLGVVGFAGLFWVDGFFLDPDARQVQFLGYSGRDEFPAYRNGGFAGAAVSRCSFRRVHWSAAPRYPGCDHRIETALRGG